MLQQQQQQHQQPVLAAADALETPETAAAAAAPPVATAAPQKGDRWKYLIADFSQIELRIAADIAGDEKMIEAYQKVR